MLTGGGAQLKHIKQLVEYITGMDTRIGYPNEHLAGNSSEEISSPLYATAVGLVMNSLENKTQSAVKLEPEMVVPQPKPQPREVAQDVVSAPETEVKPEPIKQETKTEQQIKRSFFDRYVDKIKEFLDNAE